MSYGATMNYLSSESHLSIHTFVDEGKKTLYLFTCSLVWKMRKERKSLKTILMETR
jgi:S-adenosylmethionine/arginine decarboxylase-like enzyme